MLTALSQAGVGRYIGDDFVGALAYADDVAFLAPSASALRTMFAISNNYANDYLTFNAGKFKFLVVLPSNRRFLYDYIRKSTFYAGYDPLDYVDSYIFLGHIIMSQLTENADILKRWNEFVR